MKPSPRKTDASFRTIEEVKAYLAGDKIACLLCGKKFTSLGGHLHRRHGLTSDDYRLRYGIPLSQGLAGKAFREQSSRHIRKLRKEGRIRYSPSRATIRKMLQARQSRRPLSDATRHESRQKLLSIHGKNSAYQPRDFEEFVRRCRSGRAPHEVERDPDMPSRASFLLYLKRDPHLRKRYEEIWDALPFAVQVRANKTGERYRRTLVRLRLGGKTWKEVARQMNVSASTVRSMWHVLKRRGEIAKYG